MIPSYRGRTQAFVFNVNHQEKSKKENFQKPAQKVPGFCFRKFQFDFCRIKVQPSLLSSGDRQKNITQNLWENHSELSSLHQDTFNVSDLPSNGKIGY